MKDPITVSVIMATYNGEKYIEKQLDSIVPHLQENDELIISDDGSTDHTNEIIERFISNHANIKLIKGPQQGVVRNFEYALKQTTKDVIMFADQDDVWLEQKLPLIRKTFTQHPNVELVLHDMYMCSDEQIKNRYYGTTDFHKRRRRHGVLYNLLYSGYYGCCMCFRKDLKNIILPFSTKVNMYDQWIGLICEHRKSSMFLYAPLIIHRIHGANMTKRLPLFKSIKSKARNALAFIEYIKSQR